jgi:hypothetical protein
MPVETTLTDFLRRSGSVLEQVDVGDVRLQRRDGQDLYLKRADREEAAHESLAAAGSLLVRMLQNADTAELLREVVADALPWARFLPDGDRASFLGEFARTLEAAAEIDNFTPVGTLLRQWRTTAQAWADPSVRAALEAELDEGDRVARPATG